ncbi:MAG TPA: hypothetical protein VKB38_13110 [Terracidiphilus sp.]|nr:hypothetical protein [Terracidiphilus sp.]
MDFREMKERILIVDVLLHYGVRLRRSMSNEEYAFAACPLPMHPAGDKNNNAFNVHLPSNRWQCKHPACARMNMVGNRWGDCLNLVMALDGLPFKQAGERLERWFPENKNPAPHIEARERGKGKCTPPSTHTPELTSPSDSVKGSYMKDIDAWFDELIVRRINEPDAEFWHRVRNGVKSKLVESFKAGRARSAA